MSVNNVSRSLQKAADDICMLVDSAKLTADSGLEEFLNSGLGAKLGPAIGVLARLYQELEIDSWEKLENTVQAHFRHVSVQDAFEDFLAAERRWDQFLLTLDQDLKNVRQDGADVKQGATSQIAAISTTLSPGDDLNLDIGLVNARTGEDVMVSQVLKKNASHEKSHEFIHFILLRHFA